MKIVFASLLVSVSAGNWNEYKRTYGKYYNGDSEDALREATYIENSQIIAGQNALNDGLTFGENQFTDMTPAQYAVAAGLGGFAGGDKDRTTLAVHTALATKDLADSVDWTQGDNVAVNPVKDQGQCGSCWAFSTNAATEGAFAVAGLGLKSLAEQFLVDCSHKNSGCNGGLMDYGFAFYQYNTPVTEDSYPYTAADGSCKSTGTAAFQGSVAGFTDVTPNSLDDLASAVNLKPVSIAIQANQRSFQMYKGGVLQVGGWGHACGTSLDHGVAVVGYGTDTGVDYWKVRNSWGSGWGEGGYIRIQKSSDNLCGVLSEPSFPQVSTDPTPVTTTSPGPAPHHRHRRRSTRAVEEIVDEVTV